MSALGARPWLGRAPTPPAVWQSPRDLLPIWPWVLRQPLFSCQPTALVGSGPPCLSPILFSLAPPSQGPY